MPKSNKIIVIYGLDFEIYDYNDLNPLASMLNVQHLIDSKADLSEICKFISTLSKDEEYMYHLSYFTVVCFSCQCYEYGPIRCIIGSKMIGCEESINNTDIVDADRFYECYWKELVGDLANLEPEICIVQVDDIMI